MIPLQSQSNDLKSSSSKSKKSQGKTPLILLLLLLLGGGLTGGWYWWQKSQGKETPAMAMVMPPTPVELAEVEINTIEMSSEVLGNLEASQTLSLQSEVEGRLREILVREGDMINEGDILFRLDSDSLQAEIAQAKAQIASRQALLSELQAGSRAEDIAAAIARVRQAESRLANAKKGASQEEIAQAKAQIQSAKAENQLAQQRVNRYRTLKEEGAISQDQFDDFITQAKTSQGNLEQAQRRLNELQQGNTADVTILEEALEEARQNLLLLKNGARQEDIAKAKADVKEAEANLRRLEIELSKTDIKAPISGQIGNIPIKTGDYIETNKVLTTITENNLLELNISIPLEKSGDLKLGLPVQVLDGNDKVLAEGSVDFISPNVTSDSQLLQAKATFSNLDTQLLNRQFIPARIVWNTDTGILIPSSAIFRIGGQAFVFTAEKNPDGEGLIAKQRAIALGEIHDNNYRVLEGLKVGETIITAGILKVQEGSVIAPMTEKDKNP